MAKRMNKKMSENKNEHYKEASIASKWKKGKWCRVGHENKKSKIKID